MILLKWNHVLLSPQAISHIVVY